STCGMSSGSSASPPASSSPAWPPSKPPEPPPLTSNPAARPATRYGPALTDLARWAISRQGGSWWRLQHRVGVPRHVVGDAGGYRFRIERHGCLGEGPGEGFQGPGGERAPLSDPSGDHLGVRGSVLDEVPQQRRGPGAMPARVLVEREVDAGQDRVAVGSRERAGDLLVHESVDAGLDDKVGHRERLAPVVGDQGPFDEFAQWLERRGVLPGRLVSPRRLDPGRR